MAKIKDTNRTRGVRVGRRNAVFSGIAEDPLDNLLTQTSKIPMLIPTRNMQGEYDFLNMFSTSERRRLAGAMVVSNKKGFSIDVLQELASRENPNIARMNPDEFGEYYFKQALKGLDVRAKIREVGGLKKYQEIQDNLYRENLEGLKQDFLANASDEEYGDYLARRFSGESVDHLGEGAQILAYESQSLEESALKEIIKDREELFKLRESKTYKFSGSAGEVLVNKTDTSLSVGSRLPNAVIVDLDDTLFTPTKVARKIEAKMMAQKAKGSVPSSAWAPFNKAIERSKPIPEMIDFVKDLQNAGIQPVIMTARDEATRKHTTKILSKHGINTDYLMFRGLSQEEQDLAPAILKTNMMQKIKDEFNILGFLDDSKSNLEAGYKFGVPLGIQPSKGGYDSLEASIVRGVKIAEEMGDETFDKAMKAAQGFARAGKVSNSTLEKIFEAGVTAMNVAKNKIL